MWHYVLLFILFRGGIALAESAPSDRRIARQTVSQTPCTCYFEDSCGCVCPRPITWEQFQLLPQNFRSCRGFTLALRGGQFHSFPADYFYKVGDVAEFVLDVSKVSFQYLLDPDGESSPLNRVTFSTAAYIRMHEVTVSNRWNWESFYDLSPSQPLAYCEVQVIQSTVARLTADFSRICKGAVTVANVVSSGTMILDDRVFATFYKLYEVDLSNNRIQVIMRSHFPYPALELERISLANNNIRSLPNDMFTEMPSLERVDLRGNPITTLDETTFRPIFRYVEIGGLETLPLNCDCRTRWLKEPAQLCGANVYGLAGVVCQSPSRLRGYSFFNDTLAKDLVC